MSAPALFCNRSLFIYKHDMFAVKYLENSETYGEENKTALQFSPPPTVDKLLGDLLVFSVQTHVYSTCLCLVRWTHVALPFWGWEVVICWQFHRHRPHILTYWNHLFH